jgi:hypothetical protein
MCDQIDTKLLDMEDDLATARDLVQAVFMAASHLGRDNGGPIQRVADAAFERIMSAQALLSQYRAEREGASQEAEDA